MSFCTDKKFENMIHAYELSLLEGDDLAQFEQHLLECDHCFESIKEFKSQADLIKNDNDFKDSFEIDSKEKQTGKKSGIIWRVSIAAAAVFILLLLKPWNITIETDQTATAAENKITILYFDNLADPEDSLGYGEMFASLLIADLSSSNYLTVTTSQNFSDLLRLIGKTEDDSLSQKDLTEIVSRTDTRWLIRGEIEQVQPEYVITINIIDARTGDIVSSEKVSGETGMSIFELVDIISEKIKIAIKLPDDALLDEDIPVANVTTNSEEAYRYYLEGVKLYRKYYRPEALPFFKEAIKYDSTFAMAYFYLSRLEGRQHIEDAVKYSENCSFIEKHLIASYHAAHAYDYDRALSELNKILIRYPDHKLAYYNLGFYNYSLENYDKSIEYLHKAIEIDPYYKEAYNLLTYSYSMVDDYDNAILTINEYITLVTDEANPYDTRGDMYAQFGDVDKAAESYSKALEIKPDFNNSIMSLGYMYLYKGEFDKSDSLFKVLTQSSSVYTRSSGRMYLIYKLIRYGKFEEALAKIDSNIVLSYEEECSPGAIAYDYILKASIYHVTGKLDSALLNTQLAIDDFIKTYPDSKITFRDYLVQLLVESGEFDRAQNIIDSLMQYENLNNLAEFIDWYAKGYLEFNRGDYQAAILSFENSVKNLILKNAYGYYTGHFMLARSYQLSGRLKEAIEVYEKIGRIYTSMRMFWSVFDIKRHYYLGLAYEASNWNDQAAEQYEIFISYWDEADYTFDEVEDARERLQRLKSDS